MNQVEIRADGVPTWPSPTRVVLVTTDAAGYSRGIISLARSLADTGRRGVFVTANRPTPILKAQLEEAGVPTEMFFFLDCVSAMTGVMPPPEDGVMYLESPTMLEKIALRAEQALRRLDAGYVVVDSLSTLSVYNGVEAVAELAHTMITRLRLKGAGAALVVVDRQSEPELVESVRPLCDATVRL